MVTKQGTIKKCEADSVRQSNVARIQYAIGLDEGDELLSVSPYERRELQLSSVREGMACRFKESDVHPIGAWPCKAWISTKAITWWGWKLSKRMAGYCPKTGTGNARRSRIIAPRGRQGSHQYEGDPRARKVVGILSVKEDSDVMIISIRIDSSEIRQAGRCPRKACGSWTCRGGRSGGGGEFDSRSRSNSNQRSGRSAAAIDGAYT